MGRNLTPRQLKFIVTYVAMPNAAQAAREAGYSARTAEEQGCRLLRNVRVKAELDRRFAEDARQRGVTKEEIVAAHRREMYNFTDGTPLTRIRAGEALSRLLGYNRFSVTVQHTGLPPHASLEIRELLRSLPEDKLKQFEEIMGLLETASKAKLIEHEPTRRTAER
jgi:hypothetical protein